MDVKRLWSALEDVRDPEFPISIVDMGLVIDLAERDGVVNVKLTFTAMGCPATDMIIEDVDARLRREPGVSDVEIEVVWHPIWTSARLSEDGRFALQAMGIAV